MDRPGTGDNSMIQTSRPASARSEASHVELAAIAQALRGLRYGSVTVIVQDGVVVQVDRTEKNRLRTKNERPDV